MAISQVRAQFMGQWVTLTYNETTRRYEGTVTPTATSRNQPGGYYPITVEARNDTGVVSTASGTNLSWLRLVVQETAAPTLTLVSPPEGYITTAAPLFVLTVQDEAGGSGVDPDSVSALLDGVSVACTVTQAAGEYQVTIQAQNLTDGPHSLTVTVSDYDGNQATLTADYIVDTVPPELWLDLPDSHAVVDDASVVVAGHVRDATASPVLVTVGGVGVEVDTDGHFAYEVPLLVGENTIPVRAVDAAGLITDRTVYRIRLVTDRTEEDVATLQAMYAKLQSGTPWTEEELAWFNTAIVKGAYNASDLNRVGTAAAYLADWLTQAGYAVDVDEKTNWALGDIPTPAQMARYLANIVSIRAALPSEAPAVPPDMDYLRFVEANDIEAVLVAVDAVRPLLEKSCFISGEIAAGEY